MAECRTGAVHTETAGTPGCATPRVRKITDKRGARQTAREIIFQQQKERSVRSMRERGENNEKHEPVRD
ncbi:hypothetical protein EVAR_378_1 [Eumeta japonica]|uniref:Uncharacterized protein n=1 Tax=Eumeta variegata TaxID=151549 RepID=A0A4C1SAZ0_EUMVA|nr:hypothetical protein EVAR_378_1 [Eumeta japonica]